MYWGTINTVLRWKNEVFFCIFRLFSVVLLLSVVFGIHKDRPVHISPPDGNQVHCRCGENTLHHPIFFEGNFTEFGVHIWLDWFEPGLTPMSSVWSPLVTATDDKRTNNRNTASSAMFRCSQVDNTSSLLNLGDKIGISLYNTRSICTPSL